MLFIYDTGIEANAQSSNPVLLVVGDSLSAAYGIETEEGWVSLLEQRLSENAPHWRVVNGSVSGYTTLDGLNTIDYLLESNKPRVVILELGANDGLRGYPIESIRDNLEILIDKCQKVSALVVLAGMQLPQNYGPKYLEGFRKVFPDLADKKQAALIPFLLDQVAIDESKMQDDVIHPNAEGQPQILENVWQVVEPIISKVGESI